jgi:hypothetical protein
MAVLQEPSRPVWLADEASIRTFVAELNVEDRAFLEYLRQSWELPTLMATIDRIYSAAQRDARNLPARWRGGGSWIAGARRTPG